MLLVRYLPLLAQFAAVFVDGFSLKSFGSFNTVSDQESQNVANKCVPGRMEDAGLGCACSQIGRRCNDPLSICDHSHHCICNGREGYKAANGSVCLPYQTTTACPVCPTTAPVTCPTTTASTTSTTPACVVTNPVPPPSPCPSTDTVPQQQNPPVNACPLSTAVDTSCVRVVPSCSTGVQQITVTPGVGYVFVSPDYPNEYPAYSTCISIFTAPTCYNLKIAVMEFDVEESDPSVPPLGCYDFLYTLGIATMTPDDGLYCNRFCIPTDLSIAANRVAIAFSADESTGGHFKLLVTAVQTASCCT